MHGRTALSLFQILPAIAIIGLGLSVLDLAGAQTPAAHPRTPTTGQQDQPLTELEQALHVLDRLAMGGSQEDLDAILAMGWRQWVEQQLEPASIDNAEVDQHVAEAWPSTRMSMSDLFRTYRPVYPGREPTPEEARERNRLAFRVRQELREATLHRAVHSERRFEEVMAEFWRNHFNVDQNKDNVGYLANHYEEQVIRQYAFDDFERMLLASARHPAMLIYLDNIVSQRPLTPHEQALVDRYGDREHVPSSVRALARQRGLNENYARELLELHTLGVDNGYSQRDVTEVARVLTGWTAGWRTPSGRRVGPATPDAEYGFFFNRNVHDTGSKRILGWRMDGSGGEDDGIRMIVGLANHRTTAEFIAFKLCQYLVNDDPPQSVVRAATRAFNRSDGHLPDVYRAIIFHPEFMNRRNYRVKFKTPFEFVVSTLRTTDAEVTGYDDTLQSLVLMGQRVYGCEDPIGYEDPFEAWLDPGVLIHRWRYALRLSRGEVEGVSLGSTQPISLEAMIETYFPGGLDERAQEVLEARAGRDEDPRLLLGMLLGSPAFQQQ